MALPKWTDERTSALESFVGDESPVSQATVANAAEELETSVRSVSSKLRKMGYDVKFRPTDNNTFLMAASDNKIYQWDVRTGQVTQEYNYHLQPCNTVTFFDKGNKFVSTSDDKKLLVWEFDFVLPSGLQ